MSHAGQNTSSAAGPIPAGFQQVFPAEFMRFRLATTWHFTKDRHMSGDSPQLNPSALATQLAGGQSQVDGLLVNRLRRAILRRPQ